MQQTIKDVKSPKLNFRHAVTFELRCQRSEMQFPFSGRSLSGG